MSALFLFDSERKRQNKGYFAQLIKVALADNVLTDRERKLLFNIGHKLGFVDEEILEFIQNPIYSDYQPPYQLSEKIEQVYEIIKVILADGVILDQEKHLAHCIAIASGFSAAESMKVVDMIIKSINAGKDEDEVIAEYKKSLL